MFASEVCVFFEPAYFDAFTRRDDPDDRWTPRPLGDSLVRRLGLTLPDAFIEQGFDSFSRDTTFNPPWIETNEVWMIGGLTAKSADRADFLAFLNGAGDAPPIEGDEIG